MKEKEKINIVWIKRDLRTQDHMPMYLAEKADIPYIIIYVFDSELIQHPDSSIRHLRFIYHSILDLNKKLNYFNKSVEIFFGHSLEIFKYLIKIYNVVSVLSYQESGIRKSWDRDKRVLSFFSKKKIIWKEFQNNGVVRGLRNRKIGQEIGITISKLQLL